MSDLVIAARRSLLDALDALAAHSDALILVGAQAVYLHAGEARVAIAEFTTDGDLAIDPALLGSDPLIESAMTAAGFKEVPNAPGSWESRGGTQIDLMVPAAVAGPGRKKSRGVEAPPHDRHSMRRTRGLEASLIDNSMMSIHSLESGDERVHRVKVAGPAALIVAKMHKISDRLGTARSVNKDAHDVYRLLVAVDTDSLAAALESLMENEICAEVTSRALDIFRDLFATSNSAGSLMAGEAEGELGDPVQVGLAVSILANDLLERIGR